MSKYPRTYHTFFSKGATSDDRISTDISNLIGSKIVITEKLDGGNIAMTNDGVYERSHAVFTESPWTLKVRELHKFCVEGDLDDGLYIFGEGVEAVHSIEYTNLTSCFYIFGIRFNDVWESWDKVEQYSYLLDIPTVPVLFKGVLNTEYELLKMVDRLMAEPSKLGGVKEGVVIRTYDSFNSEDFKSNLQKYVRKDHVTTDQHWQRNWKKAKINE